MTHGAGPLAKQRSLKDSGSDPPRGISVSVGILPVLHLGMGWTQAQRGGWACIWQSSGAISLGLGTQAGFLKVNRIACEALKDI